MSRSDTVECGEKGAGCKCAIQTETPISTHQNRRINGAPVQATTQHPASSTTPNSPAHSDHARDPRTSSTATSMVHPIPPNFNPNSHRPLCPLRTNLHRRQGFGKTAASSRGSTAVTRRPADASNGRGIRFHMAVVQSSLLRTCLRACWFVQCDSATNGCFFCDVIVTSLQNVWGNEPAWDNKTVAKAAAGRRDMTRC